MSKWLISRLYRLILSERKPSTTVILFYRRFDMIGIIRKLATVCSSMGGIIVERSAADHTSFNSSVQAEVEIAVPFVSMVETSRTSRLVEFR